MTKNNNHEENNMTKNKPNGKKKDSQPKAGDKKEEQEGQLSELENQLAEKEEQLQSHLVDLKRIQADFENYVKRSEKDIEKYQESARMKLLEKVLAIYDDFERALESVRKSEDKQVNEGIEMIFSNFTKLLEQEGIKPIDDEGVDFDHNIHEVVKVEDSDDVESETVIKILQKGYTCNGRLLRPARVVISR